MTPRRFVELLVSALGVPVDRAAWLTFNPHAWWLVWDVETQGLCRARRDEPLPDGVFKVRRVKRWGHAYWCGLDAYDRHGGLRAEFWALPRWWESRHRLHVDFASGVVQGVFAMPITDHLIDGIARHPSAWAPRNPIYVKTQKNAPGTVRQWFRRWRAAMFVRQLEHAKTCRPDPPTALFAIQRRVDEATKRPGEPDA